MNKFSIFGLKVWYFKKKGNQIFKDSKDLGPKPVMSTIENFPPYITAAFSISDQIYYFFRENEYCKRPLIVGKCSTKLILIHKKEILF
jgi:hypothetical protein